MTNKIRPFVGKKVAEYLGEEVDDVVDFVMGIVRRHGTAAEVVDEIKGVLEDDAEPFAMVIWRMVIFESESAARGLN